MRTCAALLIALALTGHHATGQNDSGKNENVRDLKEYHVKVTIQITELKAAIAKEAIDWQAKVKEHEVRVAFMKSKLADSEVEARKIRDAVATGQTPRIKKDDKLDLILKKLESLESRVKNLEKQIK